MDTSAIREKRARKVIDDQFHGVAAQFAEKIEVAPTQVARWFMPKGNPHRRNIGERMARRIEDRCGLAPYWLDSDTGSIVAGPARRSYGGIDERTRDRLLRLFEDLTPPQRKEFLARVEEQVERNNDIAKHIESKKEGKNARVKARATT